AKPYRKGARTPFKTLLSALATRCFSTEWAGTGHSLQSRIVSGATPKQTLRSPSQRLNLPREDQFGVPIYAPIVAQNTTQQS
ncbi:MAG: hypothetical protein AAGF53_18865, partial [Pseudomonadota bacterium]